MKDLLIGQRIVLRKAKKTDLLDIFEAVYGDEKLLETMYMEFSPDLASAKARLDRTIAFQQDKYLYFCALRETDQVIGLGGMIENAPNEYAEAGLAIGRKFQHQGYGKEMLALLLDEAFRNLHAERFVYECMTHNAPSKALAAHFGFTYLSSHNEIRPRDKKPFIIETYTLTREAYLL